MTTSSQAEINPETHAVLMQLSLNISRQDDCRLGHTVVRSCRAEGGYARPGLPMQQTGCWGARSTGTPCSVVAFREDAP